MTRQKIGILLLVLLVIASVSFVFSSFAFAQDIEDVEARKAKLEAELALLEQEIAEKQEILDSQRQKSASLERDVNILKTKIDQARLKIRSHEVTIEKLAGEIEKRVKTIGELQAKVDREKESLAQLIRKTREIDNLTIVHLVLGTESLSNFYIDVDTFASIKASVKESVDEIRGIQTMKETEKQRLSVEKNAEIDAKMGIEKEKRVVEKSKEEKKGLLDISKNKEKTYEEVIAERERRAAEIRSALFALRDTAAIPFGQALDYANLASKKTGVRPAFILAILKQESNMGENVGACYLKNTKTGDGVGKNTGRTIKRVMHPDRDVPPFLRLMKKLGLDAFSTVVSCPWTSGYGGAMGPSQFIPSTWQLFEPKIAAAVGVSVPSPWDPKHAIMATALYLDELGADEQTFSAEREAACKYYSGRSCFAPNVKNMFYGNAVMALADEIQTEMIDPLLGL